MTPGGEGNLQLQAMLDILAIFSEHFPEIACPTLDRRLAELGRPRKK